MWWSQASTTCQTGVFSFFIKTLDNRDARVMFFEYPQPMAACGSVLEQDAEPQIAPGEKLARAVGTLHGSLCHQCVNVCVWMGESDKCCKAALSGQ